MTDVCIIHHCIAEIQGVHTCTDDMHLEYSAAQQANTLSMLAFKVPCDCLQNLWQNRNFFTKFGDAANAEFQGGMLCNVPNVTGRCSTSQNIFGLLQATQHCRQDL